MNIEDQIDYWIDLARYDIEVANVLLQSNKLLYVAYFSHLITEKTLKAYFCFNNQTEPPYSHNLLLLSEKSELRKHLSNEQISLLNQLMPFNIEGRYPSDKLMLSKSLTYNLAQNLLNQTIELHSCILKLMKY